ncbi:MAG: glycosyltransferase [Proteobacteria bacterium]|nr:glycosyltransferase [Pseudomonadota bacterium]
MITQASRLALARLAIGDFALQTHAPRELIVLHDADDACHAALADAAAQAMPGSIRVLREASGQTLGALRNAAVGASTGEFICQWDDDDRYHPQRLAVQWQALRDEEADFAFLCDQLHWFPARGELYWDDWDREAYPLNVVQGSLLARRVRMPRYADLARGEDTDVLLKILRSNERIARLRGAGWSSVYVYHGANTFDGAHHAAIARVKALGHAALLQRERLLRERLCEYQPGFGTVRMPHENGALEIGTAQSISGWRSPN